jgi:3-dehydro-L-gulonate 2-dehydrogenase
MNPEAFGPAPRAAEIVEGVVASLHNCPPAKPGTRARYPGEQTLRAREENMHIGLPVEPEVWKKILAMR